MSRNMESPLITRRNMLVALSSTAALAACSSTPAPRDAFYRLGAPAVQQPRAGGPVHGVLEVPPLRAPGIINERAILYRDNPRQLAQYSYHAWVEPPAVLLQQALIDVLRQAKAFDTVVSPDLRTDRDFELFGEMRQWEHVRSDNTVAIEIEVALRRVRGNQQLLLKSYQVNEPVSGDGVDAAVEAFSHGMDKVYAMLIADLAVVPADIPAPARK